MTEFKSNKMLAKFGLMYGSPSRDPQEAKAIISEYARLMVQYSEPELEGAADKLIRTRKFRNWPTIAECIEALEDHRAEVYAKNAPELQIARHPYPEWDRAAFAAADKLIQSVMGRQAAQEGWILGLHDYCRKHSKLPGPWEIGTMKEAANCVERGAAGVFPDLPPMDDAAMARRQALFLMPIHETLKTLAGTMLTKRETLSRIALGEPA